MIGSEKTKKQKTTKISMDHKPNNDKFFISVSDPSQDPNFGPILHDYGIGYIGLPIGVRVIDTISCEQRLMFRCSRNPIQINSGIFIIYEARIDLIWDQRSSFIVSQDRYTITGEVACKDPGLYIFYGTQNAQERP